MKAKEFLAIKGFWNEKVYSGGIVYKHNKKYVIDDPENLPLHEETKVRFGDVLRKLTDARIKMVVYLLENDKFPKKYYLLKENRKDLAIKQIEDEISLLQKAVKKLKESITEKDVNIKLEVNDEAN